MPTEVCQVCYLLVDKAGPSGDHVASVTTNVELASSFFDTIWVSITRVFTFLIPIWNGYLRISLLSIPFGSIYQGRTVTSR